MEYNQGGRKDAKKRRERGGESAEPASSSSAEAAPSLTHTLGAPPPPIYLSTYTFMAQYRNEAFAVNTIKTECPVPLLDVNV